MLDRVPFVYWLVLAASFLTAGCHSPYYADRGALFGGLTGAGAGAIIGNSVGNTGAGAAIGAGMGALTGAAVGGAIDEVEARNRAEIASHLGRPVQPGAVTLDEVIAMSRAGVADRLIISHIQHTGVASSPTATDVIRLHEQGVSTAAIETLQSPPPRLRAAPSGPVIVEEHHYGPPPYFYRPYGYHYHACHPRPSWGFSVSH